MQASSQRSLGVQGGRQLLRLLRLSCQNGTLQADSFADVAASRELSSQAPREPRGSLCLHHHASYLSGCLKTPSDAQRQSAGSASCNGSSDSHRAHPHPSAGRDSSLQAQHGYHTSSLAKTVVMSHNGFCVGRESSSPSSPLSPPPASPHTLTYSTLHSPPTLSHTSVSTKAAASRSAALRSFGSTAQQEEGGAEEGSKASSQERAILEAAMEYVLLEGWSDSCFIQAAKQLGLSPSVLGLFPRRAAHLVEFFMDKCRRQLREEWEAAQKVQDGGEESRDSSFPSHSSSSSSSSSSSAPPLPLKDAMAKVIRHRLELQALYTRTWPQALNIQANPSNAARSLEQRKELAVEMWCLVGQGSSSDGRPLSALQLKSYRHLLFFSYATAELYMITDPSPGYEDTWAFVDRKLTAAFALKDSAKMASDALNEFLGYSAAHFSTIFGKLK